VHAHEQLRHNPPRHETPRRPGRDRAHARARARLRHLVLLQRHRGGTARRVRLEPLGAGGAFSVFTLGYVQREFHGLDPRGLSA